MKRYVVTLLSAGMITTSVFAQADSAFDAGVKLWYAEPKEADLALMYGVGFNGQMDGFWVSGFYVRGENDFIRVNEPRVTQDFSHADGELAGGLEWDIFRYGLGFRAASVLERRVTEDGARLDRKTAYGPMLTLTATQKFAEWPWGFTGSPWGWYAETSYMFLDVADKDGEHLNVEAGVSFETGGLNMRVGYRYKSYFDFSDMVGFTGSLTFDF